MNLLYVLAIPLLVPMVRAQDGPPPTLPTPGVFRSVYVGGGNPDGSIWVRGERYKLGLDAKGAHFQPLLGPKAPRDYPLSLRLAAVRSGEHHLILARQQPVQANDRRVEVACGAVTERWDFAHDHAEQSFVLAESPGAGELVIDLEVETELVSTAAGATELTFSAPNGLGGVHCRDAAAIDAAGRRLCLPFGYANGHLQLRVPAEFVATATFPLVIDPVLSTFAIDTTISDMRNPRLDYEPTNDVWLVVQEEQLSATDVDIQCQRYSGNTSAPVLLDTVYAANTPDLTFSPDVGTTVASQRFQIAWCNATGPNPNGSFQYRYRSAGSTTQGGIGSLPGGATNPSDHVRVGGSLAGDRWLLAEFIQLAPPSTIRRVQISEFDANGQHYGSQFLSINNSEIAGDVSTLRDASDHWCVIWSNCPTRCAAVPIQMIAVSGVPVVGGQPFVTQPMVTLGTGNLAPHPTISGFGGNLLAAWNTASATGPDTDIEVVPIGAPGGVFQATGPVTNLSLTEPNGAPAHSQFDPAVSYDGVRFVCAYVDDDGVNAQPFATTMLVDANGIAFHEGHLALSPNSHLVSSVLAGAGTAPLGNATLGHHGVVWAEPGTGSSDTFGAFVDARTNASTTSFAGTACGLRPSPQLNLVGTPALGRTTTFVMGNVTGLSFLLLGAAQVAQLPGCGVCQSGVQLPVPFSFVGPTLSITWPGSASFHGSQWSVQGLDLLHLGGCPASVFGAEFAVTDTINVRIL